MQLWFRNGFRLGFRVRIRVKVRLWYSVGSRSRSLGIRFAKEELFLLALFRQRYKVMVRIASGCRYF